MDVSSLAIKLILLLLPGITSAILVEQLTVHKPWTQFRFFLYSFVLGILDYLLLQVAYYLKYGIWRVFGSADGVSTISFWTSLFEEHARIEIGEVLLACVVGALVGTLVSKAVQEKWIFRLARRLSVSDKHGDESLFSLFLGTKELEWVYVRDFRNRVTYFGLRSVFSEANDVREVVLSNVTVYSMEDSRELYKVPNVYLSFDQGSLVIEHPKTSGGRHGGHES